MRWRQRREVERAERIATDADDLISSIEAARAYIHVARLHLSLAPDRLKMDHIRLDSQLNDAENALHAAYWHAAGRAYDFHRKAAS